jgi:hypothetical protein
LHYPFLPVQQIDGLFKAPPDQQPCTRLTDTFCSFRGKPLVLDSI